MSLLNRIFLLISFLSESYNILIQNSTDNTTDNNSTDSTSPKELDKTTVWFGISGAVGGLLIISAITIIVCYCQRKEEEQQKNKEHELDNKEKEKENNIEKEKEIEFEKIHKENKKEKEIQKDPLKKENNNNSKLQYFILLGSDATSDSLNPKDCVNEDDLGKNFLAKQITNKDELKQIVNMHFNGDIVPQSNIYEEILKNKNLNESSFVHTELSLSSIYNKKLQNNNLLGVEKYNSEGNRSNPDEDYFKMKKNYLTVGNEPKIHKAKFVLDENDILEHEMKLEDQNVDMIHKLFGFEKVKNIEEIQMEQYKMEQCIINDIEPQEEVLADVDEKLKKLEFAQRDSVIEFKTLMNQIDQLGTRLSIKEMMKLNGNSKDKVIQKDSTENLINPSNGVIDKGHFDSQEREIPNDSFYQSEGKSVVVDLPEEEPEFIQCEMKKEAKVKLKGRKK